MVDMHLKISLSDRETKSFTRSLIDYDYEPNKFIEMLIGQFLQRQQDMRDADDEMVLKAFNKVKQGE